MDALTAAKARIERALNELEQKFQNMKARSEAARLPDDDLFAPLSDDGANAERMAELEAAGQQAAEALSSAAQAVREILEQPVSESITETSDVSEMEPR